MSYDYSSAGTTLELPNPYKVQNALLFVCSAVLVAGGLFALTAARQSLAPVPLAIGIALLFAGVLAAGVAAKRLRFFFGRGRPHSLAPEIPPTATGNSPAADWIKRLLREGALPYPEPSGAVDGVLYHWVPQLITAPLSVQQQARSAFFNVCAMVAASLSFVLAWGVFGAEASRPLLSAAYFVFGLLFLLRPFLGGGRAGFSTKTLVALIAAAVVGPAVVSMAGKGLPVLPFSLAPQTFMLLVSGTLAAGLLLLAALQQVSSPPPTQTSMEQLRLSLNVPPSLLLDELERRMQEQWTERIPNRRYARATPVIQPELHAGPFNGELLEESQPIPIPRTVPASIGQALGSTRHRFLAGLDLYATLLTVVATVCACLFTQRMLAQDGQALPLHLFGASSIFLVVAGFCFRSSAQLWGRFDFQSVLVWVEMDGTYQTASVGTGNQLTAKVHTSNQIVRTEAMTLRVWRARVESVVFGKDGRRQITAMFSTDAEARELGQHLSDFGRARASLVAPDSAEDMSRIAALAHAERALTAAVGAPALPGEAAALLGAPAAVAAGESPKQLFCRQCGARNLPDARFCQGCGERMTAA
ncbi:zinc ribbon domain-containing protein [Roseateles sp. BYS78W]|uniref:Zinc ribbon domain-containing protein n=1 Tax=Pelomonas candidula TaxID=3299025 RepID=A0ABW7H8H2_9BURK